MRDQIYKLGEADFFFFFLFCICVIQEEVGLDIHNGVHVLAFLALVFYLQLSEIGKPFVIFHWACRRSTRRSEHIYHRSITEIKTLTLIPLSV